MKNSFLFRLVCQEKLDAFWLAEDIKEFIPESSCEFLDDDLKVIKVSSSQKILINEIGWLIRLNKIGFKLIAVNNTQA